MLLGKNKKDKLFIGLKYHNKIPTTKALPSPCLFDKRLSEGKVQKTKAR